MNIANLEKNHTEGNLPEKWVRRSIRSVSQKTLLVDPTKEPDEIFQYVDVSSVNNESWKISEATPIQGSKAPSRARKKIQTNDVIFATVRPTLKRVALVPTALNNQVASTAFCVIKTKPDEADPRFVYYSLLTDEFAQAMGSIEHGASYPAVTDSNVLDQEISLPPLPEQKAIALVLSRIQSSIEVQDKTISSLKELKAATMTKLFQEGLRNKRIKVTPIGKIPEDWSIVPLGEFLTRAQYGLSIRGERYGQFPILRMNCQDDGLVVFRDLQYIDLDLKTAKDYLLDQDDLLFNRTNSFELVGRTAIYQSSEKAVFASYLVRLSLKEGLNSGFLNYYLNQKTVQTDIKTLATRAVGQSNISASKLKTFNIPVPPDINEQNEIRGIIDSLSKSVIKAREKKAVQQTLFSLLLHNIMTGKVRVREALEYLNKEGSHV